MTKIICRESKETVFPFVMEFGYHNSKKNQIALHAGIVQEWLKRKCCNCCKEESDL